MSNGKTRSKIYIRILAALMSVYLVLMLCFSAFIMYQQENLKRWQDINLAAVLHDAVERSVQNFMDSENNLTDIQNVKKELVTTLPSYANTELKMAVFTGDFNLLYNSSGRWVCSYTKEKVGNTYYTGYALLNPKDWFDEATVDEIESYLYAEPSAKKIGDLSDYNVNLRGFWLDNEIIIPDKISITAMYAYRLDEQGNVNESMSRQTEEDIVYESGYQNDKDLPYFDDYSAIHKPYSPYGKPHEKGNRVLLEEWVVDREKLITAVENLDVLQSEKTGLFTKGYYYVRPYWNGFFAVDENGNKEYCSPILSVFAWETNLLHESRNTLIILWSSSFLVFIIAACVIGESTYRTYQKREAIEKQRIDTTSALAHDLKTPLSIISGYAQNLLYNVHTEKRDYYAQSILENINRMDGIIQEMLELYRLNPKFFKPRFEDVSLNEVCSKVSDRYADICQDRNIKFSVSGDAIIMADSLLIERVIDNFFVNAVNNTGESETIGIQISANKFEIFNSGGRIPDESIDEIWNVYKKVNISPEKEGGTGLGLVIARIILELHSFSYGAENTDIGVVFWFGF